MVIFDTENEAQARAAYDVSRRSSPRPASSATASTARTSTSWTSPPTSTVQRPRLPALQRDDQGLRSTPTASSRPANRASGPSDTADRGRRRTRTGSPIGPTVRLRSAGRAQPDWRGRCVCPTTRQRPCVCVRPARRARCGGRPDGGARVHRSHQPSRALCSTRSRVTVHSSMGTSASRSPGIRVSRDQRSAVHVHRRRGR